MPRSCQAKGKRAENEVCRRIERAGLGNSVRTPGSGSGKKKGDIFNNLDFLIEVKNQKSVHFGDWVAQAKKQASEGNIEPNKWCLAIIDPNGIQENERMDIYAVIEFDEFLDLYKRGAGPKVKEPDRALKLKLELLKEYCRRLETNPTDMYYFKRFKLLAGQIIKEL